MKTFKIFVFAFSVFLTVSSCLSDDIPSECQNRLNHLSDLKIEILDLMDTSVCGEEYECRYIGVGSKPCGGPWEFLFYTTSIDTLELQSLVAAYNALEADYNENCDAVSNCSTPVPPVDFTCENNQCIPIY